MPWRIWTSSTIRLMTMTLPRMITIATSTEIGSEYIRVVVGITTAVHTPEGMMYAASAGHLRPPQETSRLEVAARRATHPSASTTPTHSSALEAVLLNR